MRAYLDIILNMKIVQNLSEVYREAISLKLGE